MRPTSLLLLLHNALFASAAFFGAATAAPAALFPTCAASPATFAAAAARAPAARCAAPSADAPLVTCGKCKAAYTIDAEAFGTGQKVRCSNCGHEWFQTASRFATVPAGYEIVDYPAEMKERLAQGKSAVPESRFRCFVGNLAFAAEEDELREIFERYGTVVSVTIMTDENGSPKGYGFVNMESPVAGAKAVEELNGYEFCGRAINVSEGKQSASRGRGRGRGDGRGRGRGGRGRGGP
jgi:predicted Zn finger-like uncharacterized protein